MEDEKVVIKVPVAVAMEDEKVVKVPAPLMVDNKQVLPVTLTMEIKKKEEAAARFPMLLSVQGVLKWAFLLACCVAVAVIVVFLSAIVFGDIPCSHSQMFKCPDLTPEQGVEVESLGEGILWFTVPQAAAAAAGLLLPRRRARSRWSLALAAIVSATVAHYMNARMTLVFIAANPEDIAYSVLVGGGAVVYLAGDLLGLVSLLIRGPE